MSSIPIKRACDACHRRKVRCNSGQPCENCSQAGLSCTYDAIPQKKGPKGSRAKVISELRQTHKLSDFAFHQQNDGQHYGSPPRSPAYYAPTVGLVTQDLIQSCVDSFFARTYPSMPILHREQISHIVAEMAHCAEAYCLVVALCSFVVIQPGIASMGPYAMDEPIPTTTNPKLGTALVDEAVRVRKGYEYVENPTVNTTIASYFLFNSCFGLNKQNAAWFHLREATAMAQILGMQEENTHLFGDVLQSSRRRLFWLLFVTERVYALQKNRSLTLHATVGPPAVEQDSSTSIAGLVHLVNLYRPFDDKILGLWNKTTDHYSLDDLAQLRQKITLAVPVFLNTTESQAADLRISQQWLRNIVWHLSISNRLISSNSPDTFMTFIYPIEIAKDLVTVTSQFSKQSMEVHGIGLIEKIFDIACSLIDVMCYVPVAAQNARIFEPGPQNHLNQLLTLICSLRGGEARFLPLIMTKVLEKPQIASMLPPHLAMKTANRKIEEVKQETSGSSSASSSPYNTPNFMHYYPPS